MSSRMVPGWIEGQWTRKEDHPVAPGCESSPHAMAIGVDVSEPPPAVVGVSLGIHSVAAAAGLKAG
jgi:hypothetical protein